MVNQAGSQAGVGRRHRKSNRKQQEKVPLHDGDVAQTRDWIRKKPSNPRLP
jgi:hypothetical protein